MQKTRVPSDCWAKKINYATWTTSQQCSNPSVSLIVTQSSGKYPIWKKIWPPVGTEWNTFIQKRLIESRKLFRTRWNVLELNTKTSKHCSGVWFFLNLSPIVCKKRTSKTIIQQKGLENMFSSQSWYLQTFSVNQSFSATLIFISSFYPLRKLLDF